MELRLKRSCPPDHHSKEERPYLIHTQVNDARVNYPAGGSNYVSNQRAT